MAKDVVKALILTTFNTAAATANLQLMNPGGLEEACTIIDITNNSNIDVYVSFDGINLHWVIQRVASLQLPSQANNQPQNRRQMFPKGMGVWIASITGAAGAGNIYLSGLYSDPT